MASFHATLEETLHADVLIHVVDASSPDAASQIEAVDRVLAELSWHTRAEILALNKVDQVREPLALQLLARAAGAEVVHVSARSGEGLERLTEAVAKRIEMNTSYKVVNDPMADSQLVGRIEIARLRSELAERDAEQGLRGGND